MHAPFGCIYIPVQLMSHGYWLKRVLAETRLMQWVTLFIHGDVVH